jgi:hypothetical protein
MKRTTEETDSSLVGGSQIGISMGRCRASPAIDFFNGKWSLIGIPIPTIGILVQLLGTLYCARLSVL